ncbi:22260_t:CDS:2, partial [Gigaspora margarita]
MNVLLSIVLFCLINFHKSIFAFVPSGRAEHNAVLVDKKLYFYGGYRFEEGYAPNQLFYLDVSKSFTTFDISLMPWTDLSSISGVTCKSAAAACADESTIYYIGGSHTGGLVSKFDTILLQWSEPITSGSIPTSSIERPGEEIKFVQCVNLGHKIHIYGGFSSHKMNILDTSQLYWSTFTSSLMYSGTLFYSAALLNDSILYIGGAFNTVDLYFSRILGDCQTNSNQEILNVGGPLKGLVGHTSTLIGAYVLIAFATSDIFLLDVSHKDSYKWVTTYDPINSIQPIQTSPTSPTTPSNISIGAAIAGMIGSGII